MAKRHSMRDGPLAQLFKATEAAGGAQPEEDDPAPAPAPRRTRAKAGPLSSAVRVSGRGSNRVSAIPADLSQRHSRVLLV